MISNAIYNELIHRKQSKTQYPIEEVLKNRWSPLAFSDRPVEHEKLCSVLEAARWAASSYNEQPWSFIMGTKENPDEYDRLFSCLAEGNQEWANTAPVLILSVAKLFFDMNGDPNRHAFRDVGAAEAQLAIQATALGLVLHQMAGFDVEKARDVFEIPAGYDPVDMIALGYLGDPQTLSDRLQQRESSSRDRKPFEQFVFAGHWNRPSPIVQ